MIQKLFPEMYDRPENGPVAASAIYWIICYFMIPFVTQVLSWAFSSDLSAVIGVDLVTYVVNFLCILGLFRPYLADSFLNVQINTAGFVKTVLIASVLILVVEFGLLHTGMYWGWDHTFSAYPMSETSVVASAGAVVLANPLWGTLCMTVLTPVTVSCMFYGTVFAPIAANRPVLAYVVTAVLMVLPRLLSAWWLHGGAYDWMVYLMQMPVHMIACWSYQKTNTIWAPIFSLSVTNLLSSLLLLYLAIAGFIYIV